MRFLLAVVVLAAAWTAGAQGTSEAVLGFSNAGTALFNGAAGWTFQTTTTVTVTELGCLADFFPNNDATQIQVGLWGPGGSLLASNTITSTSSLTDQSRYESVAPVALNPGQTYSVGVYYPAEFSLDGAGPSYGGSVTNSEDIILLGTAQGHDGFSAPPAEPGTAGNSYLGPNFQYEGPLVPEPSSCLLLALGGALLAARRRRHQL
jgi:hypothetical protein